MVHRPNRYFGTDGIRAQVGVAPMVPEVILKFGWAIGKSLLSGSRKQVLIGKDTRVSGYMFESALEAGLSAAGIDILLLGPLPTPGVAYLTRTLDVAAGLVISASHNPYDDNGIKIFFAGGRKLLDEEEKVIEKWMDVPLETADILGKARRIDDAAGRYTTFCKSSINNDMDFRDMKIVVDCANGAGYMVAPRVFEELGATVYSIGDKPDGFNINKDCGTLHPENLQNTVLKMEADLGIAIDGDGDRLLMVDEKGEILDGDELLMIIVDLMAAQGDVAGVVGTQMSNLGLEKALVDRGIDFFRTQVGDRYIIQALDEQGWLIGGEPSGHIICMDKLPTGDALIAALQVIYAIYKKEQSLSDAKKLMFKYPQTMINVPFEGHFDDEQIAGITSSAEQTLGDKGRIVVRPSGTEQCVRVMVEAENKDLCDKWALEISHAVGKIAGKVAE